MNHGFHFYKQSEICWNSLQRLIPNLVNIFTECLVNVNVCLHCS